MNWPRAIRDEIKTAFELTLAGQGSRDRKGWLADRHLRSGFILGLLPFLFGVAFLISRLRTAEVQGWIVMFLCAIVSNLVWLGYAAWSRNRELEKGKSEQE